MDDIAVTVIVQHDMTIMMKRNLKNKNQSLFYSENGVGKYPILPQTKGGPLGFRRVFVNSSMY